MNTINCLFLTRNCPECAYVNARLPLSKLLDEKFTGKDGNVVYVYSALTEVSMGALLSAFGINADSAPVLKTAEGRIITDARVICSYLGTKGLINE